MRCGRVVKRAIRVGVPIRPLSSEECRTRAEDISKNGVSLLVWAGALQAGGFQEAPALSGPTSRRVGAVSVRWAAVPGRPRSAARFSEFDGTNPFWGDCADVKNCVRNKANSGDCGGLRPRNPDSLLKKRTQLQGIPFGIRCAASPVFGRADTALPRFAGETNPFRTGWMSKSYMRNEANFDWKRWQSL